jgi:hypothetical protein
MNDAKYIGLDVHQATISAAVLESSGRRVMESILETKAATILQFLHGLRGSLHVTSVRLYLFRGCKQNGLQNKSISSTWTMRERNDTPRFLFSPLQLDYEAGSCSP